MTIAQRIEWRCLGDEYQLIQGPHRRVLPSELWWNSFSGGEPTQEELQRMWNTAHLERSVDTFAKELASLLKVQQELEGYVQETEQELSRLKAELALGNVSKAVVSTQESLVQAARAHLQQVKAETRGQVA